MSAAQDQVQMVAVGVGDEDLAELVAGHQPDNLFNTVGIELVEDVVQE